MQGFTIEQLANKSVVVLGAGLTGLSCVRFLNAHSIACSVNDSREQPVDINEFQTEFPKAKLVCGKWDQELIKQAEVLLVSPGIDLNTLEIAEAISPHCDVMGDVELFSRLNKTPIIAVTGSNGKSTVVSLLQYLGEALGYKVALGGNIGVPVLEQLDAELDFIVLELSSFQLETIESMQALATCVLNVSDDHLDRHHTLDNYAQIKQKIYQQSQAIIYNRDDVLTYPSSAAKEACQQVLSFGENAPEADEFGLATHQDMLYLMQGEQTLIAVNELPLAGIHNALNCLAVLALGKQAGWDIKAMLDALAGFKGLAHRCENVSQANGIAWVNDSKATNVGATLAAINGLASTLNSRQKLILIAGGEGKGADFSPLFTAMKQDVAELITLGKDGAQIAALYEGAYAVESLEQAVSLANDLAKAGDLVLLSPACASLDMFPNYMARGKAFVAAIESLPQKASEVCV